MGQRPYVISYFLLVVIVLLLGYTQRTNTDRRFHDQQDTANKICAVQSDNRNVLRMVIIIATTQTGNRLNLTGVPEFQALDPHTQAYLTALQNQGSTQPNGGPSTSVPNQLQQKLLEQVPQLDCHTLTSSKSAASPAPR